MKNPYSLLGIAQNADAQQLREAYQALAQRHGGDARRMREIGDAYEAILLSRGGESDEAIARLACVPENQRGSEWHYRMGCVQRERGWLREAENHFAYAAQFEPGNRKYHAALKQIQAGRSRRSVKSIICDGSDDTCLEECCGPVCCECCCESPSICASC